MVDVVERAVTTYVFFGVMFVLCNFRLCLLYGTFEKSASEMIKITTVALSPLWTYSVSMSVISKVTASPKPKTKNVGQISLLLAGILALFAVTQLITLGAFTRLVESFWLPGSIRIAHVVVALLIMSELLSLLFLLRLRLSIAMRIISMVCGWVVVLLWLGLCMWLMLTVNAIHNVGFLGTLVDIQPGWWAILFTVALGILSAWASWGMWPLNPRR